MSFNLLHIKIHAGASVVGDDNGGQEEEGGKGGQKKTGEVDWVRVCPEVLKL